MIEFREVELLGRHINEDDAARAYNKCALEIGYNKEALNIIHG